MLDSSPSESADLEIATEPSADDRDAVIAGAFEAYGVELYGFLRRSTRDAEAAEDLLQETFVRLTQEARAGRMPDAVRPWLYRVASNLAVSRARRQSTILRWLRGHRAAEDRVDTTASPELGLLERERSAALDAALGTLAADARVGLLLAAQGFSGLEIAAALGRSHAATRTMLSRARVQLREVLEHEERPS